MKKNIIYGLSFVALSFLFNSCDAYDDDNQKAYAASNFAMFADNQATLSVSEDGGSLVIPVSISKPSSTDVTVNLRFTNGTAQSGVHFNAPTSVVIPAGQISTNLTIAIVDDTNLNATRSFNLDIASVSDTTYGVGISDEGSYSKTISIINNDCPTKFTYWVGNLSVEDVGYGSTPGTGAANSSGDCDILVVTNDLPGLGGSAVAGTLNTTYNVFFTPTNPDGSVGTVLVNNVTAGRVVSGGVTYDAKYNAVGTYSTVTGQVVMSYELLAVRADGSVAGLFYDGTTILRLR